MIDGHRRRAGDRGRRRHEEVEIEEVDAVTRVRLPAGVDEPVAAAHDAVELTEHERVDHDADDEDRDHRRHMPM